MLKLFVAAMAIAAAAPAIAGEPVRFERDGQTYVYTVREAKGAQVIQGRRFPSGSAFRLVVKNGRASGVSGGVPVAFAVPAQTGSAGIVTAQR